MFAVIVTGGKQYLVEPGQSLRIEKLDVEPGKTLTFDQVLLVNDKDSKVGSPTVSGAKVTATVVETAKAAKVTSLKFHNKVRYKRTKGHRQLYTLVKIEKISG